MTEIVKTTKNINESYERMSSNTDNNWASMSLIENIIIRII